MAFGRVHGVATTRDEAGVLRDRSVSSTYQQRWSWPDQVMESRVQVRYKRLVKVGPTLLHTFRTPQSMAPVFLPRSILQAGKGSCPPVTYHRFIRISSHENGADPMYQPHTTHLPGYH